MNSEAQMETRIRFLPVSPRLAGGSSSSCLPRHGRLGFLVPPAPNPQLLRRTRAGTWSAHRIGEGWAREEAVLCTGRTPSMRVRGARWAEVRQSQQEREKERLMKSAISDLEVDPRTVDGEGGEQDQTGTTTVPLVYTSNSAGPRKKVVVPPPPEIDTSSARDHMDPKEEILKGTITTAASPNLGVQQRSLEHSTEPEEGRAAKRKPFSCPSGSQTKAKYSSLSVGTNTSGSIKETSSIIEKVVALNPQSNVVDQSTILEDSRRVWFVPWKSCLGVRFRAPGVGWRCLAAAPRRGCEPNNPSVSNVLLDQPDRASLPKVVQHAQSISEKEQDHEDIKEAAFIPVHNTEETNSEFSSEANSTKLLEQANMLVMENKHLKDGQVVLLQQVKDQKQMIDELSKQNRALVQKCAEVDWHKEKTAQLIKDKEELQWRVSQANELLKLMTDILDSQPALSIQNLV